MVRGEIDVVNPEDGYMFLTNEVLVDSNAAPSNNDNNETWNIPIQIQTCSGCVMKKPLRYNDYRMG